MSAPKQSMTYANTGVNYDMMDPFKREAQKAAMRTAQNLTTVSWGCDGYKEFVPSRGESAYLLEGRDNFLAIVEEGLGTKNLVADAMEQFLDAGETFYADIAQDTVAMIVNDIITVGARALSVQMHLAVGDSSWFSEHANRAEALIQGWRLACNMSRCAWGGGETPTLKGIVVPGTVVLSGSAVGVISPKKNLMIGDKIRHGDEIILVESSGIHANGLTLARKIAENLSEDKERLDGYLREIAVGGRAFGVALLEPTKIYASLVEDCLNDDVCPHYAVNITGHGWRKLMRATQPFTYVIDTLPTQNPLFDFMMKHGPLDMHEAYGTLNMGAGFALYVNERDASKVLRFAEQNGHRAFRAGHVEHGEKKVVISPLDLEFTADTLAVR